MQDSSYLDLGVWGYLSTILAIVSYVLSAFVGIVTSFIVGRFLLKEYRSGNLGNNRLLFSVWLVLVGVAVAAVSHLITRIDYILHSGSFIVPFAHSWASWSFTIGHFMLAAAMVNLLVVFTQDAGLCPKGMFRSGGDKNAVQIGETETLPVGESPEGSSEVVQ